MLAWRREDALTYFITSSWTWSKVRRSLAAISRTASSKASLVHAYRISEALCERAATSFRPVACQSQSDSHRELHSTSLVSPLDCKTNSFLVLMQLARSLRKRSSNTAGEKSSLSRSSIRTHTLLEAQTNCDLRSFAPP